MAKKPAKQPESKSPSEPDLSYIAEALRPSAVPINSIDHDPANVRLHSEKNLSSIRGSLRVYGQRKPIVVNRRTGTVEAGNGTLSAARSLGWTHIAVVFVDDDQATAAGFAIADNRTAELAEWDRENLGKMLSDLVVSDDEMMAMLEDLKAELPEDPVEVTQDEAPAPPDEPVTKPSIGYCAGTPPTAARSRS